MDILLLLSKKKLGKINFLFNYKLMWMTKKIKEKLCQVLLQFQYNSYFLAFKSIRNSISFQIDLIRIQFFRPMLPWSLKMKVKHLIKQA